MNGRPPRVGEEPPLITKEEADRLEAIARELNPNAFHD